MFIDSEEDRYGLALGADARDGSTRFGLWSNQAKSCAVKLGDRQLPLQALRDGFFALDVEGVGPGARYSFVLDGEEVRDPYARWLPDGVEAPAEVWRSKYEWHHVAPSRPLRDQVLYELHVGAFTPEGTYAAAKAKLPYLAQLGVTTLELMPLAAFKGERGWGYDGVAHFAPHAPYGTPDELRSFIDAAHGHGLQVLLDVVYNHFGPVGNVLYRYSDDYFASGEKTAWGDAPNYAHPAMRRYLLRNARYWLEAFRFDGLRLDATHAIVDRSPRHVLTELADEVARLSPKRFLIAEDERNDPKLISEHGLDAVWADDLHHQVHVALTHERDGYYAAFGGTAAELAETIENGWFYRGAKSPLTGQPRGADASALPAEAFVYCLQNHDQVGNRAFGDRLGEKLGAAAMLLLFLPETPLLFMGQEWAASTPFLYFTDLDGELGKAVTLGRRNEFSRFAAFQDEAVREKIPDPQARDTFRRSQLDWVELHQPWRSRILEIHRAMLKLRANDHVLKHTGREHLHASASGSLLMVERRLGAHVRKLFINLNGRPHALHPDPARRQPRVLLSSDPSSEWGEVIAGGSAVLVAYEAEARR